MNNDHEELLSAYLDGALSDAEHAELEARLKNSSELRRELDDLRAVSAAVKNLPKEPLPSGFMSRFNARRARPPRRDWVFLPPMARPIALALSCGVVALVVWDKTVTSPEPAPLHSAKEAALADMKSAPVSQLNFASRASGFAALSGAGRSFGSSGEAAGIAGAATEVARRGDTAPRLNEDARDDSRDIPERKEIPRLKVRARGMPTSGSVAIERGSIAVSEEARSAKNEELFNFLESQKKKMGIARVVLKDDVRPSYKAAAVIPKIASPAPVLLNGAVAAQPAEKNRDGNSPAPADKGRLAADAGLVFSDAGSLASSWVLLGFPGQPPAVDFAANRIVLMKPSAAIILSVDVKPNSIDVTFRTLSPEEVSNPVKDRAMVIPREPRAVLLFDVSPR